LSPRPPWGGLTEGSFQPPLTLTRHSAADLRQILGAYVIVSALALFIVGVTGFRQGRRWAWYAACCQVVLFAVVQIVGGGGVIAVAFGIIAMATLGWS
jgi:hypothetical protein